MPLPRYFVPRDGHLRSGSVAAVVAHAFDVFFLQEEQGPREWVIGFGPEGGLTAQPVEPRFRLAPAVLAQLTFHETCGRGIRRVNLAPLYLFEAHTVAHAPDLPGLNDPLIIHGDLVGPVTEAGVTVEKRAGQLMVPRADLLRGFVAAAADAFHHADAITGRATRTFHAAVPADRAEDLAQGRGVVIAYPAVGGDPTLYGPGNEALVDAILYDVLKAVWRDFAAEPPPPPRRRLALPTRRVDDLPVPSRSAHEARLAAEGFTITGDRAVRRRSRGWKTLFRAERRRLPPQGNTDVFLDLAGEALHLLPWPGPPRINAPAMPPITAPPTPPVTAAAMPPVTVAPPPPEDRREQWIRRFIEAQDQRRQERGDGDKDEAPDEPA